MHQLEKDNLINTPFVFEVYKCTLHIIQICSGITRGTVLSGELYAHRS